MGLKISVGGERLKGKGKSKISRIKNSQKEREDNSPLYALLSVYINSLLIVY